MVLSSRKLLSGCVSFAKRSAVINNALRYNPIYYKRISRLLNDLDAMDRAQRIALVDRLTRRALRWACAAGAKNMQEGGLNEWPILEKEEVRDNPEGQRNRRIFAIPAATGGTTGVPIQLWRSLKSVAAEQAFQDQLIASQGLSFRSARIASIRADDVKPPSDRLPPFGYGTQGGMRLNLSSRHITDDTVEWYVDELNRFKPNILYVLPTSGEAVAVRIIKRGLQARVPLILSASEILHPGGRNVMETAFNASVIDWYGMAERVVIAHSKKDGEFWINPAYGWVELLPISEDGLPSGQACAEIIATGFWNEAMPLIRYRTGDHLVYRSDYGSQDLQDVALGLKPFIGILGRDNEYLLSPHGQTLIGMDHLPKEINRIVRMQVVQEALDEVRVLVIPAPGFGDADRGLLMTNIRRKIPNDMKVRIELVAAFHPLPNGKIPYVIRKV